MTFFATRCELSWSRTGLVSRTGLGYMHKDMGIRLGPGVGIWSGIEINKREVCMTNRLAT